MLAKTLYRLVEDLFDTLVGVHAERFEPQYGRLRHTARRAATAAITGSGPILLSHTLISPL